MRGPLTHLPVLRQADYFAETLLFGTEITSATSIPSAMKDHRLARNGRCVSGSDLFSSRMWKAGMPKQERKASAPPRFPPRPKQLPVADRNYRPFWLLLGLLSAGTAVAAVFWFHGTTWPPDVLRGMLPRWADNQEQKEHRTSRLILQNSRAGINQPLPLGIALDNGTGRETVIISGFIEGTSLSAGAALSATRWSVSAGDLEKAFISPPQDFEGIMKVNVTLYSPTQDVLQSNQMQFEWGALHKGDKLPVRSSSPSLAR